jgi:CheY-like chemotaxis protein
MPRALVVDDDPDIQKMLKRLLERHGFEVVQALDADTGFKFLSKPFEAGQFRYIFLDHDMPGERGDGTALALDIVRLGKHAGGPWFPAGKATFVIHSANPDGAARMAKILKSAGLRVRVIPKDKLINLLMYYKPTKP